MTDQPAGKNPPEAVEPGVPSAIEAVYQGGDFRPLSPLHLPAGTPVLLRLALRGSGDTPTAPESQTPETIAAVFQDGLIRPLAPLPLPAGTPVRLHLFLQATVQVTLPDHTLPGGLPAWPAPSASPSNGDRNSPARRWAGPGRAGWPGLQVALAQPLGGRGLLALLTRLDLLVLALVMLVYGLVRFIGLTDFPIFFFSDEAIHTNQGIALIRNGLRSEEGVFLPPYFRNVDKWNLSLSVYLQGASAFLFGKSVWVSRATSAGITLLAGIAVALALRLVFRLRFWWVGPLALAALPVWFLHSRTSFETVLMVSFYACFLCAYLIYRVHDPRALLPALFFGAAAFYSYSGGQGVMLVSGVLLLVSDLRYHLRTLGEDRDLRNLALIGLGLVAIPYIWFRLLYPGAFEEHLRVMNSIWIRSVPLGEKLASFFQLYLLGLSPSFWFAPNNGIDLSRHTFKDWGNFPLVFLPLVLVGLGVCLRRWRSPAHRVVLIAILAAPVTAALAQVHNYRVLAMVIPAAILVSLGIDRLAGWLIDRQPPGRFLALGLAVGCGVWLVGMNFWMLRLALSDGPTWYSDYGLYGQQYGAMQVFPAIAAELHAAADTKIVVSPDWANNPDEFVPFFLPPELHSRVTFLSPNEYLKWKHEIDPATVYVLPAFDYDLLRASAKLEIDPPLRVLPYPDGRPGFFFVRMGYVENIDEILAAERAIRMQPVEGSVEIDGQAVKVKHSRLDLGSLADLFDNDHRTLIRGFEANPLVLEFEFPTARPIREIGLDFWRVDLQLTVTAISAEAGQPQTFTAVYRNLPEDPHVDFTLPGGPVQARRLRIELLDLNAVERAKIHVPGLWLR